jgi:hypothetical protein
VPLRLLSTWLLRKKSIISAGGRHAEIALGGQDHDVTEVLDRLPVRISLALALRTQSRLASMKRLSGCGVARSVLCSLARLQVMVGPVEWCLIVE